MKTKVAIVGLALFTMMMSGTTLANDNNQQKMNTIKAMYQQDIKKQNGNATLMRFAGANLQKALKKQDAYGDKHGELCGLDYDVLWQSQDPDYRAKLQYSLTSNGQVKVNIGRQNSVSYSLACQGGSCKISDVISGGSVIKMINQTCR